MSITAIDPSGETWVWKQADDAEFPQYASDHYAIGASGDARHMPWSRFAQYTAEHFEIFVAAGFPDRSTNWTPAAIEALRLRHKKAA